MQILQAFEWKHCRGCPPSSHWEVLPCQPDTRVRARPVIFSCLQSFSRPARLPWLARERATAPRATTKVLPVSLPRSLARPSEGNLHATVTAWNFQRRRFHIRHLQAYITPSLFALPKEAFPTISRLLCINLRST